ncbi:hypothetical protein [Candidatus Phyllobacterium onerii]|uniref:hypothetical protein n=1 Tax=Candidatus Phyllobacterium onerii TaxID=3020828 RepID=UPI00232C0F41|nr:hypothetical protein [Phyllobacterium sp. IY22]
MKKLLVLVASALCVIAFQLFHPISRAEIGISDKMQAACNIPAFENLDAEFPGKGPNYERVAADFLPYAVAGLNAYRKNETFVLANYDDNWHGVDPNVAGISVPKWNGLDFAIYTRNTDEGVEILVAFRGTDGFTPADNFGAIPDWLFGNASWFTQWVSWWDQYSASRSAFQKIRTWAGTTFPGKNVYYTTVGHSLGGGLAQHVARAFPCVRAVAFNSSCVTNEFRLEQPYTDAQTVLIYEDKDPLSWGCNKFFGVSKSNQTLVYGKNNLILTSAKGLVIQHSMEGYSAGMSRMVLCCAQRERLSEDSTCTCSSYIGAQAIADTRKLFCGEHRREMLDEACDFINRRPLEDQQCVSSTKHC